MTEIPSSAKETFNQLPEITKQIPKSSPISKWQATHESWKLFDQLREKGCFCDVTLKSQEGVSFPAHRLIICTCSEYFRSVFLKVCTSCLIFFYPNKMYSFSFRQA